MPSSKTKGFLLLLEVLLKRVYELDDMDAILGKELKLDKTNAVRVNKVYCFDGTNANAWEKARLTNPENPVKADIIDKNGHLLESGRLNIKVFTIP